MGWKRKVRKALTGREARQVAIKTIEFVVVQGVLLLTRRIKP